MKGKHLFASLVLAFFAFSAAFSQTLEIKKSNTIVSLLGSKFYVHVVKPGQTLYAISKTYNVDIDDIIAANINIEQKIKVGDAIRVPIKHKSQHKAQLKFIYHTVKAKETLYFLGKKYKVDINDILRYNPEVKEGLKSGMVLKIPTLESENYSAEDNSFFYHRVEPKQTLFSLAKTYDIDIDIIIRFNPSVSEGLRAGELLKIPKGQFSSTEILKIQRKEQSDYEPEVDPLFFTDPDVIPCNQFTYEKGNSFKIALMLPLSITDNNWLLKKGDIIKNNFFSNSVNFYNFYQGILLATEKLRKEGLSIELFTYDTEYKTDKVDMILSKPELKSMDLIIGPVYPNTFEVAAKFAKQHRINIISPISSEEKVVLNNPFVFQVAASTDQRILATCNFLSNTYDSSIVVVNGGSMQERLLIETYKKKLVYTFANNSTYNQIVFKEVNYKTKGISGLEDALSVGMQNIIIIPSSDEVFVSDVLSRLEFLVSSYQFIVIGMPNWQRFENIDIGNYQQMKVHFPSPSHINYEKWPVKDFVKKYHLIFKTDPSAYSFQGFDVMYYFGNELRNHGKHFQFCNGQVTEKNKRGLRLQFDFNRYNQSSGFVNQGIFMLKFDKNFDVIELR